MINKNAGIHADALENGNGGVINVWGTDANRSFGTLTTREADSGQGGLIETSGHWMDTEGSVVNAGKQGM